MVYIPSFMQQLYAQINVILRWINMVEKASFMVLVENP